MAGVEFNRKICEADDKFLNSDVLSDVMRRVDGATLARLGCVITEFRSASQDESLWENLCNQRWPSTKQPLVKTLISSVGGFRKLYNNCFPFVSPAYHEQDQEEESASAADFVTIVDVTYNGDPVFSRVVEGIPGAGAVCGPLVDILGVTSEGNEHGVAIHPSREEDDGPIVTIHTKTIPRTRDGRFWMALCNQLRVSWILVHKKTHRMVNLASWKPSSGVQHRPYGDNHFLLRFGTILPYRDSAPVHCNITMRCRPTSEFEQLPHAETPLTTVVKLTDLGLTLEDIYGMQLRGKEAVSILSRAMACDKSAMESKVSSTLHQFLAKQTLNRKSLIRSQTYREKANTLLLVGIIVIILISYVLV